MPSTSAPSGQPRTKRTVASDSRQKNARRNRGRQPGVDEEPADRDAQDREEVVPRGDLEEADDEQDEGQLRRDEGEAPEGRRAALRPRSRDRPAAPSRSPHGFRMRPASLFRDAVARHSLSHLTGADVTTPNGSSVRSRGTEPRRRSGPGATSPLGPGCSRATRFAVQRSRWHVAVLISASSVVQPRCGFVQQLLLRPPIAGTAGPPPAGLRPRPLADRDDAAARIARPRPAARRPDDLRLLRPAPLPAHASWLPRCSGDSLRPAGRWTPWRPGGTARRRTSSPWCCSASRRRTSGSRSRTARAGDAALELCDLPSGAQRGMGTHILTASCKALTFANRGRRLVLKSPPHTAAYPTLLKLFPDARFVHVVRDPYAVYPSTLHLWRVLCTAHGPPATGVGTRFRIRSEHIRADVSGVLERPSADPARPASRVAVRGSGRATRWASWKSVYRELELGDFEPARPHVEEYLADVRGTRPARYILTAEERRRSTSGWGEFFGGTVYAVQLSAGRHGRFTAPPCVREEPASASMVGCASSGFSRKR